jgi:hypothetical protein
MGVLRIIKFIQTYIKKLKIYIKKFAYVSRMLYICSMETIKDNGSKPRGIKIHEELDQVCGTGVWDQIQESNFRYYESMTDEEFKKWCEEFQVYWGTKGI